MQRYDFESKYIFETLYSDEVVIYRLRGAIDSEAIAALTQQ